MEAGLASEALCIVKCSPTYNSVVSYSISSTHQKVYSLQQAIQHTPDNVQSRKVCSYNAI